MIPNEPSRIDPYVPPGAAIAPPGEDEGPRYATGTEPRPRDTGPEANTWARWLNLALGVWLLLSSFLWVHGDASFTNTWVVGILIAASASIATMLDPARWVTAALAVWLFFSSFAFAMRPATLWNNAIVAVIVFLCTMIPGSLSPTGRRHTIGPAAA